RNTLDCVAGMHGLKEMVLYHAIDATRPFRSGSMHNQKVENARILLGEKKEQFGGRGFRVETRVRAVTRGDIATSILEAAEEEHVSLVIMGSRGRTLVKGLLLGSVSSDVLRFGKVPLLILSHEFAGGLRPEDCGRRCGEILSRVLCATDFSPAADRCAAFLAGTQGIGKVILAHVVTKGETEDEIEGHVKDARGRLERMSGEFKARGYQVSTRVHVGDPVNGILRLAREEDVTLIAVGTVGKNWLKEILMGSTTLGVVRHADLPVLVLRVPPETLPQGQPDVPVT
ncbi:MAG: universal stress protein, partial [Methanomicrobiales archaeon]|nr:universal stress protein [Methanomicrobiales archaeon]